MGFAAVYQCLQELFPQLDARLLKAVAIEHPKDADAAVEVILSEVLPHMVQKEKIADSRSENMSSLGHSDGEDEQASLSRRRHMSKRVTVSSLETKDVSNGIGNAANSAGNSVDADSTFGDECPFYDANDGNDHPGRAVDNEALIVSESSQEMSVVQADKSSEVWKHSGLHPCDAIDDNEECGNADGEELILLGMEKVLEPMPVSKNVLEPMPVSKKVLEPGPTNGTSSSSYLVSLPSNCESGWLSSSWHIDSKGSSYSDAGVGEKSSDLETFLSEVENADVELALLSPQEHSSEAPSCVSDIDTDAHGNNCADGNVEFEFESSAVAQKLGLSCTDTVEVDDDPPLNMTRSGQICSVELLEEIIEDAKNNKKTLFSAMESVMNMMKEVEEQERAAEVAKEEAAMGGLDILSKVEELTKMLAHAKETNDMHAGEVYGEKAVLATEVRELQSRLRSLSDERDKSLAILDEMHEALESRLAAAEEVMKAAENEKQEKEEEAQSALAEQEAIMEVVVQESKVLQEEAEENSKLREFLMEKGRIVDILQGEISVICLDVKFLKEKFDERVPLSKSVSSSQTSCLLASSSSSRKSTSSNPILDEAETCGTPNKIAETAMIKDLLPETTFEEEKSRVDLKELTDLGWEFFDKDTEFGNGILSPTANGEFRGFKSDIHGCH
ncbi:uncharacterized protein LOC115756939 isoform X2 [Rhodamnia argentea]|uniref:Uncharacterized protein LOC115756939 isoform X2 n=1 Tax=Rhodamnia argentea TaxID=178133 RepID=A0ABM3HGD1_9MYRT|nr:uncharacterized protein LOC115756939 isoform X2 [Rhodamnia argentea]